MNTTTTKKPFRRGRDVAQRQGDYRLVKDPISGLTVTKGPVGSPRISSTRIKAIITLIPGNEP